MPKILVKPKTKSEAVQATLFVDAENVPRTIKSHHRRVQPSIHDDLRDILEIVEPQEVQIESRIGMGRFINVHDYMPKNIRGHVIMRKQYPRIYQLPEGFSVGGNLDLRGSKVEYLPKDLEVGGNLYLNRSITFLPVGLKVGGDLFFTRKIREIPDDCEFGSNVRLKGTQVRSIGNNCTFNGDLILLGSKVTEIGRSLKVKGLFAFHKSKIKQIPEDLEAGDYEARGVDILHDLTIPEWLFTGCTVIRVKPE